MRSFATEIYIENFSLAKQYNADSYQHFEMTKIKKVDSVLCHPHSNIEECFNVGFLEQLFKITRIFTSLILYC